MLHIGPLTYIKSNLIFCLLVKQKHFLPVSFLFHHNQTKIVLLHLSLVQSRNHQTMRKTTIRMKQCHLKKNKLTLLHPSFSLFPGHYHRRILETNKPHNIFINNTKACCKIKHLITFFSGLHCLILLLIFSFRLGQTSGWLMKRSAN